MARPKIIKTREECDKRIDSYLDECRENEKPVLLTGMCLALGFCSKDTFYNYQKDPVFSDSIRRGRLAIETGYETNLHGTTPTGSIFALKNMNWKDERSHDVTHRDATGVSDAELEAIATGSG